MASGGGGCSLLAWPTTERGVVLWEGGCEPAVLLGAIVSACGDCISGATLTSIEGRGPRGVICSTATPTDPSLPQHSDRTLCPQNDWNILTAIPIMAIIVAEAPPAFNADSKSIYIGSPYNFGLSSPDHGGHGTFTGR